MSGTPTGQPLPAGFLGFSTEVSALHAYLGRDPNALNPIFLQLLEGIDQGQPPILRVGGNSTDESWVALPGVLPPLGVTYTITQDWLATVHALTRQTHAHLILGVNLAADDPQIAGVEARALVDGIGAPAIEALEIGNEPDLYLHSFWYQLSQSGPLSPAGSSVAAAPVTAVTRRVDSYAFRSWQTNFDDWQSLLPRPLPIAAGALAILTWLNAVDTVADSDGSVALVTAHRYPLTNCGVSPSSPNYPTIVNLLSSSSTEGLAATLAPYATTLHAAGRNLRIDELNTASCEGRAGVSDTFASALWMVNELFDMAAVGVDGINVHTLPGADYAPFTFTLEHGVWTAEVRPIYYGMLMFAAAFPPGASLLNETVSGFTAAQPVKIYTTEDATGVLRTTIINEDPADAATVQLSLPDGASSLTEETLTAPSLSSETDVRLGERSFADPTSTGRLSAPLTSTVAGSGGNFTISVPAGSAVLLSTAG